MEAQTLIQVALIAFLALLALRIAMSVPSWIRRARRPEGRAIRVVGIGGGGSNAVDHMVRAGIRGVDFIACNTDAQALRRSSAETRIRIGDSVTHGLGSGGDPEIGRRSAEEDVERLARALAGSDLVFVTAGLGGGTGSGAGPIVAAKAKEQGALTVGVVTKPFGFEGPRRRQVAEDAAALLSENVDALIVIPNDGVATVVADDATMLDAFAAVDDVLRQAVQGILDLIAAPGLVNLDFADIRAVLRDAGPALIGLGRAEGPDRGLEAARQAISSPLLEASIEGARGILFHVAGPSDLRLREVTRAAEEIRATADPDASVIFGATFDPALGDRVRITLIATGLASRPKTTPAVARAAVSRAAGQRTATGSGAPGLDPAAVSPQPETPASAGDRPRRPTHADTAPTTPVIESPTASAEPAVAPSPAPTDEQPSHPATESEPADGEADEKADLDVPSFLRRGRSSRKRDG